MIHLFKKTNPNEVKAKATSTSSRGFISSHKNSALKYKWKDGKNLLRLLPQMLTSPWGNFCEYSKFAMFGGNIQGDFAIEPFGPVSKLIFDVSKALRNHPEHRLAIKSKDNETGVSINTQPRVVFLGFDFMAPENGVKVIDLPGTYSVGKDGKERSPGAGTIICQSIYETDIKGNIKYGDIFDIETGRVVSILVQNSGTMRAKYIPSIDAELPITEEYEELLEGVKEFDAFIDFKPIEEVKDILRKYLPEEMVADLPQLNEEVF